MPSAWKLLPGNTLEHALGNHLAELWLQETDRDPRREEVGHWIAHVRHLRMYEDLRDLEEPGGRKPVILSSQPEVDATWNVEACSVQTLTDEHTSSQSCCA